MRAKKLAQHLSARVKTGGTALIALRVVSAVLAVTAAWAAAARNPFAQILPSVPKENCRLSQSDREVCHKLAMKLSLTR